MFLPSSPIGVNPINIEDRTPVWQAYVGDDWVLTTKIYLPPDYTVVATPQNSLVYFSLAESQFSEPIFTATWDNYISLSNNNLVQIQIPRDLSDKLRRGSYTFSISVINNNSNEKKTVLFGTLLVDYSPNSPHRDIPYR